MPCLWPRLKILSNPEQFNLCLSDQVLCFRVTGCTGGSIMFKCPYKSNDQHKGKYFCRDRDCTTGISTETQHRWVYDGRFSLYDDENSRFFTVLIRNLSREDDSEYTCGNNQTWSHVVTLVVNRSEYDTLLPTTLSEDVYLEESQCFCSFCNHTHLSVVWLNILRTSQ
uniref:Ig-like domain-containing protein n=1 Tax=Cyprinus carpio TaxID=7962 RepID=A0A8C1QIT2_CYPCA